MGITFKEKFDLLLNMDGDKKTAGEENFEEIQRIRMTLKGRETKPLEWACSEIVSRSKNKGFEIKGPVRIPTKTLRVTVRKSPCGEGTNTWDIRDENPQESNRHLLPLFRGEGHRHLQDRPLRGCEPRRVQAVRPLSALMRISC